jgi:hypothetical protein
MELLIPLCIIAVGLYFGGLFGAVVAIIVVMVLVWTICKVALCIEELQKPKE